MNNFGLGLVLSFTDNATSGVQRATGAFNALENSVDRVVNASSKDDVLMGFAYSADKVGKEIYGVGRAIIQTYSEAVNGIVNVGTTMQTAQAQLEHLYGSAEAGSAVLGRIKTYAAQTVFGVEELIPTVVMLKSHGIEAFDEIATSAYRATNGMQGYSQTLLDYASDLAAFNPNMSNVYGKGIEAAMGAIKEYIAEGNSQFLKRGASLDINQLLGEDTAKTAEERSRQIADLIEKMGMVGMTANLASTPMQKLANISDTFYNIVSDIANSGVMEFYNNMLSKISTYIASIPQEELKNIADLISSALVELMTPLEKLVDFLISVVDKFRTLVKENPELVKSIVKGVAIGGVISLITGAVLKLTGSLGFLRIALGKLFGGSVLSSAFKLLGVLKTVVFYFGPIIAAVFLLKQAWDRDFMGMQDTLRKFVKNVVNTFKILFDAWKDYTLSADNFELAKQMGILPFIEAILQLKYHLGFLFKGIKDGFNAFFDGLAKALTKMGILDKETHGFRDLITSLLEKITQPGMTDTWEKIGFYIGEIGGWVLLFIAALPMIITAVKTIGKVVSAIVAIVKFVPKIISAISAIVGFVKDIVFYIQYGLYCLKSAGIVAKILGALKTIGATVLGIITMPIVAIPLIVAAVIFGIYEIVKHWDDIVEHIKERVLIIRTVLQYAFKKFWDKFLKDTPIGDFIEQKIVPILVKFQEIREKVFGFFTKFVAMVVRVSSRVRAVIGQAIGAVVDIAKHVYDMFAKIFRAIYQIIRTIVLAAMVAFKWLNEHVIQPIIEVVKKVFGFINDHIIQPVVNAIKGAFQWVYDKIIGPIVNKISEKLKWLKDEVVMPIFNGIKNFINNAVQAIEDFVTPIFDAISEAIAKVHDKIVAAVDAVGKFFGGVGDFFEGIGDDLEGMLGLSTGGYVKSEGAAVLHPNEVVLNDILTQRLGKFLADYDKTKTSPLVTQNIIATDDYREREDPTPAPRKYNPPSPIQSYVNTTTNNSDTISGDTEIDNSVVFESGSIVFQIDKDTDLANMSEEELNKVAEKLMRIMARKAQLRTMQTRK